MPARLTLSVPKPCHENWATMTPAAQGRHCAAYDKVVVDFTRMTDAEILAYLGQSAGKSCGRFRAEQLNRPLMVAPALDTTWRSRWMALVAVLGLGTTAAPVALAQTAAPVRVQQTVTLGMVAQPVSSIPALPRPPLVVRGVVWDATTHSALPGVTVLLKGTTIGVSSDKNGEFELAIPEWLQEHGQLQLSAIGFLVQQLHVSAFPSNGLLPIELAPDSKGEVVVTGGYCGANWYTPRGFWQRLTRPFRQL